MSEIKPGDRVSWPLHIFPGPTLHPTEREYGTVDSINPTLEGGHCYSCWYEGADPPGWIMISAEIIRKESPDE